MKGKRGPGRPPNSSFVNPVKSQPTPGSKPLGSTSAKTETGKRDSTAGTVNKAQTSVTSSSNEVVRSQSAPSFIMSSGSNLSSAEASLLLLHSLGIPVHFDNVKKCIDNASLPVPSTTQVNVSRDPLAPVIANKSIIIPTRYPVTQSQGVFNNAQCRTLSRKDSLEPRVAINSDDERVHPYTQQPVVVLPHTAGGRGEDVSSESRLIQSSFSLTADRFVRHSCNHRFIYMYM